MVWEVQVQDQADSVVLTSAVEQIGLHDEPERRETEKLGQVQALPLTLWWEQSSKHSSSPDLWTFPQAQLLDSSTSPWRHPGDEAFNTWALSGEDPTAKLTYALSCHCLAARGTALAPTAFCSHTSPAGAPPLPPPLCNASTGPALLGICWSRSEGRDSLRPKQVVYVKNHN